LGKRRDETYSLSIRWLLNNSPVCPSYFLAHA
jgi:hypothetical protein